MGAAGLKEIKRADGVGIKIIERNRRGSIVRWLSRRMHEHIRLNFFYQARNARSITDVELMVREITQTLL